LRHSFNLELLLAFLVFATAGCGLTSERRQMPAEVEAAITSISDDIAAERYEKIYDESDDLWKQDSTQEESTSLFKTMRAKLGGVKNRTIHTVLEQQNSGGSLKGRSFSVSYRTSFEKAEGMELFTLVERDHKWRLARYRVNSTALR
jgi:hypothetical protein